MEVCSVYPERNEVLINAGRLALSSETSPGFPGYGLVDGVIPLVPNSQADDKSERQRDWYVRRISQEHGIMAPRSEKGAEAEKVWKVGDKAFLHVSHACITAAAHPWYYVVENGIVEEVWRPWHGW